MKSTVGNRAGSWWVLGLLTPSLLWFARDHAVWPWDPSWYGEVSTDLWWFFSHRAWAEWWQYLLYSFTFKAPGISWLGQFFVPAGRLLGSVEDALLCCTWLFQSLSVLLLFKLGTVVSGGSRAGGWLAALIVSAAPLFVGMTQSFFTEPLQLFCAAWVYWIAAKSREQGGWETLLELLLATALGLLVKVSTPLYTFAPTLLAVVNAAKFGRPWLFRARLVPLLGLGLGLSALTFTWYFQNFSSLVQFVRATSSGSVALNYGSSAAFLVKLGFWIKTARLSLGLPFVVIGSITLALGTALIAWKRGRFRLGAIRGVENLLCLVSVLELMATLVIFSRQINEDPRYLLPVLPAFVVVLAWLLGRMQGPWPFRAALALFALQFVVTHGRAHGFKVAGGELSGWLLPATLDAGREAEITRLISATTDASRPGHYVVNGFELPWLNANTLCFYAAKARLKIGVRPLYRSLGYAQEDPDAAWRRMAEFHCLWFISLDASRQPQPADFLNRAALPILNRVAGDPEFERAAFASNEGMVLYRRKAP